MLINVMRAKLHRLTVTQADLNYIGSISLDPDLIEAAGLVAVSYTHLTLPTT